MAQPQAPSDGPETALEAVERAERRLEARSLERSRQRERLLGRRERRERYRLPVLTVALGLASAVVFLVTVEAAGGDLSGIPSPLGHLVVVAELFAPPAVAAWLARGEDRAIAFAVAVCVFSIELAVSFGLGFAAFGLGPK
jgi:hypothetical protein